LEGGRLVVIIRTYHCRDCDKTFEHACESADGDPECPTCSIVLDWVPQRFAIGGSATSKAVDYTQQVLEQQYGETNLNDQQREGDIAHKNVVRPRAEQEVMAKLEHDAKEYAAGKAQPNPAFWAGGQGGPPANIIQAAMAGAKEQTALANREGCNPMDLLHQAGKAGTI
jgi:hypothetical protein